MKPFREQNQVTVGVIGLTVIGLIMLAAFKAQDLPLIGGGTKYSAQFSEAGGLKPNDEIRVAGVRVGQVRKVELEGTHVRVDFVVDKGVKLGDQTGAEMKIKTLLGQKYLKLNPSGDGELKAGSEIPLARTVSAYDVVDAFSDLANTTERIDTAQLAKALDTLSATFKNTPEEVQASLTGLSRLSRNVAKRDEQLKLLLQHSERGHQGPCRPQPAADQADEGRQHGLPGRAGPAGADPPVAGLDAEAVRADHRAGPGEPQGSGPTLQKVNAVLGVLLKNQNDLDASIQRARAVRPGLHQHARHRAVVRRLPAEPGAGPGDPAAEGPDPGLPPILGGGG